MNASLRAALAGSVTGGACRWGHRLVLALGSTWRVRHVGREHADRARFGSGPVMYVFTHGVLLPLTYTHRNRGIQVLISESRDGEIIARITGSLGFGSVRGSSTRGGARAVVRMSAKGRRGYDLGITPDGPRGPRGSVSLGAVLVSARGGVPIIPLGVAADRAFRARSWDRFLVPAPFARVFVTYGPAIWVETGEDFRAAAARIERAMADVEMEAAAYAAGGARPREAARVPA